MKLRPFRRRGGACPRPGGDEPRPYISQRLQETGRRLWRWFFPTRIEPPEEVRRILAAVYPTLDLAAVSFHRGLPHLLGRRGIDAITLPALLAPRRTRIYVAPRAWEPATAEGIGTLLHEAYHALQAQEAGWGCGPLQPFLILYFAHAAANLFQYGGHPMEEDAYRLAGRRRSPFESACEGLDGAEMERVCAGFATPSSGPRFWRRLAVSTPWVGRFLTGDRRLWAIALLASPLLALWLLLWAIAVSLAWLARLLVEGGGAVIAGSLGAAGFLLSRLETISLSRRADL